jgi:hypothetical protein
VSEIHLYVGFAVVSIFAMGWLWGLGIWISRRDPGQPFWWWLTAAQVIALLQALIGSVLLLMGRRPTDWLHLVYGYGPILIFGVGHSLAREEQFRSKPWAAFALASFICFGLTLRALMTGLGVG